MQESAEKQYVRADRIKGRGEINKRVAINANAARGVMLPGGPLGHMSNSGMLPFRFGNEPRG
ncbi:hypothetical protein HMPREF3033_01144 [Veillonellaceae bacterium DNF00751]|uniref:Uncharacterized protein n=1 Tax=Megasphaera lornae TaxID=1000568 RepID=D3LSK5_9FIRM|nr:hypothetical protein HMPREF0889_0944 [Megasphaera genomosp. type_1 str. 28L]EGL41068.1 hypothetical protein HMPREF1039_1349 [Megasphaera lornae]KXB91248.1 hypothetical protein HMPREF3033_01144 [Veillonellaceae bacterium DNF00751]